MRQLIGPVSNALGAPVWVIGWLANGVYRYETRTQLKYGRATDRA